MSTRRPEPEIVEHLIDVLHSLITLLSQRGESVRAAWLTERLAVLQDGSSDTSALITVMQDLNQVVLGMNGLMDLHLKGPSQEAAKDANTDLRRLADQLYELTR